MFTVCQGTCFCAVGAEGFSKAKQKVLYCFGEVSFFPIFKVSDRCVLDFYLAFFLKHQSDVGSNFSE